MFMRGGPPHGYGGAVPFPFVFGLSQLLLLAILILLVCLLVRRFASRGPYWNRFMNTMTPGTAYPRQATDVPPAPHTGPVTSQEQPSALEILNRRYANGEIDATTYEHMRERIIASDTPKE
jgi:hypothetical protein